MSKPSYIDFDTEAYKKRLSRYTLKGEIGVLSYPYSKKIHKYWKFKNNVLALESAKKIYQLFKENLLIANSSGTKRKIKYFIRADICRKFLQMGYTRSMRYYYHKSGKKWGKKNRSWYILPNDYDDEKKNLQLYLKNIGIKLLIQTLILI